MKSPAKRIVKKEQLVNSTFKAQCQYFKELLSNQLLGAENFDPEDLPNRGIALINIGVNVSTGYTNWNAMLKGSIKTNEDADSDFYFKSPDLSVESKLVSARYIQLNFIPDVDLEKISSAISVALIFMPSKISKNALTKKGKKFSFSLTGNQLKFNKLRAYVSAIVDGKEFSGFAVGFSHKVCPKTGCAEEDLVVTYLKGEDGKHKKTLLKISQIKDSGEFDYFESFRKDQIGGNWFEVSAYASKDYAPYTLKFEKLLNKEVAYNKSVSIHRAAGFKVFCNILDPMTKEVHSFRLLGDGQFDLDRMRELYNDSQQIIYTAIPAC